jgi:hypothetical protein
LESERPARFSERTDHDREREIALEIAREAAAIKKEEDSTVGALLLIMLVLNRPPDRLNVCRCRVKRLWRLVENCLRVEVGFGHADRLQVENPARRMTMWVRREMKEAVRISYKVWLEPWPVNGMNN